MKAQQILLQLFKSLPKYSPFFSTTVPIVSLSLSISTVTATTSVPHNLLVGQTVNITGAIIKNPIVSLTQIDNVATAVTQFDHDLTEGFNAMVEITGANQTDYNGNKELLTVPNRRTFTFKIANNPVTPATGTIFLVENDRSINPYTGIKIITSVPTSTTFTYMISSSAPNNPTGQIKANTGLRIGGAMSVDKADEWYSKQPKGVYWMFVVLNDRTASKDRYAQDDATATTPIGTRFRQRVITPFTCYVFAPMPDDTTTEGVSGRFVRDTMEDVFYALCKSLLRVRFQTEFYELEWSQVTFVNHGFFSYNQAYYVHQFSFESTFDIVFEDTVEPDENVAWRDIELDFQRLTDDYIISHMAINLDDVPL